MMNRIRALRKENRLTQAQLGDMVHASQQTISKIENSPRNDFSCDLLCALSDYFQVSTDYLLGRSEERKPIPELSGSEQSDLNSIYRRLAAYDKRMILALAIQLDSRPGKH